MADFQEYYIPQYRTTTLDVVGGIDASQTTDIKLATIPADIDIAQAGIVALTYSNPIDSSTIEWVTYTSISGTNVLQGVTRGAEGWSAKTHENGCVVGWVVSKSHINEIMDALTGTKTGVVLASPSISTPVIPTIYQDAGRTKLMTVPNTASDTLAAIAATQTLTNKRITKRVVSATSYTTNTGTSLNCDTTDVFIVTAQAGDLKFNNPSGTPTDGQPLILAVSSSTTAARALTYDTQFESSTVTLPTTTAATTARLWIGLIWRADTSKWTCVASC
jgi:hypothetical protein